MQDDDLEFDTPAAWWVDWLAQWPPDKQKKLATAGTVLTVAGCPEGQWKSALREFPEALLLPRETCQRVAKDFREVAAWLEEFPERYRWCCDTRHLVRAFFPETNRFSGFAPDLPGPSDFSAATTLLRGDADFLDNYAKQTKGQHQIGRKEARAACSRAIRSAIRASKRSPPVMHALALLLSEAGQVPVTTRSLHMAALRRDGRRPKRVTPTIKRPQGRRQTVGRTSRKTNEAVTNALGDGLRIRRRP